MRIKTIRMAKWLLLALGTLIIGGSHLWLINTGSLAQNMVLTHSIVNLIGLLFLIIACPIKTKK